jgi:hypothetical protein
MTVSPNFVVLDVRRPEVKTLMTAMLCKLVMQLNVGRGRTRKSQWAKNGGPTCWRTLAPESESDAPV